MIPQKSDRCTITAPPLSADFRIHSPLIKLINFFHIPFNLKGADQPQVYESAAFAWLDFNFAYKMAKKHVIRKVTVIYQLNGTLRVFPSNNNEYARRKTKYSCEEVAPNKMEPNITLSIRCPISQYSMPMLIATTDKNTTASIAGLGLYGPAMAYFMRLRNAAINNPIIVKYETIRSGLYFFLNLILILLLMNFKN